MEPTLGMRNVEEERCAGKKDNKDMVMPNKVRTGVQKSVKKKAVKKKFIKKQAVKKKVVSECGEGSSQSPKWTKKRAKQLALFDHEGGLIEHYKKLYEYRQALPDSNPGSKCRMDLDESANGCFKRMYNCFKGVKDGWLAGCTSANTRGGRMVGSSSIGVLIAEEERREEQEWEEKQDYFNPANWIEESIEEAPFNQQYNEIFIPSIHLQPTQQSRVWVKDTTITTIDIDEAPVVDTTETTELGEGKAAAIVKDVYAPAMDKGKAKESVADETSTQKRKRGRPPSHVDGIRIYHKNRGRSERIANIKLNKHEIGSIPDKAFDVDD
ncbi:hypothetical protein Tco_1071490 [Tanacetum coccineum]